MDLITMMSVIGNIQLATRHPGNIGPSVNLATNAGKQMIELIRQQNKKLGETLDRGWNPKFDC